MLGEMTVLSTSSSSSISHLHSHCQRRIFNPCAHNILNNNKLSSAVAINNNSYSRKSSTISAAASSYSEGVANANQYRKKEGIPLFKPQSFQEIINNAAKSLITALDDGKIRLEIEFPPLPLSISQYKGSSDEFIDANIQLAFALARKLNEERKMTSCIVFPDKPEKRRASRLFRSALDLVDGISLGSLDEIKGDAVQQFFSSLKSALDFDFEAANEDKWDSTKEASLYIFINSSTRELDEIEQYVDTFARETPALLFNLELDTLRSDLGLFGFPTKEVQYRFLSKFLPVYYIRTRDYSKTVPEPPFLLNYSGALFRQYPGPWQVMLKQTDGSYACVAESDKRFTLGQTKDELLRVLGIKEEEGSNLEFLRRGYKTATWWEEDKSLEEFSEWRN